MSVFGRRRRRANGELGESSVRCDGCGRISTGQDGYYVNRATETGGNISSHGRNCEHDYCDECEDQHAPEYACRKCGERPA